MNKDTQRELTLDVKNEFGVFDFSFIFILKFVRICVKWTKMQMNSCKNSRLCA